MRPAGSWEADEREWLELATCPSCGTTLTIAVTRLSSSARWRVQPLRLPWPDGTG
jgi:hypothetical protein